VVMALERGTSSRDLLPWGRPRLHYGKEGSGGRRGGTPSRRSWSSSWTRGRPRGPRGFGEAAVGGAVRGPEHGADHIEEVGPGGDEIDNRGDRRDPSSPYVNNHILKVFPTFLLGSGT
jgi:hypothetical protein